MPINDYDEAHLADILADRMAKRYDWFTCHLLRLIMVSDRANAAKLAIPFPREVRLVKEYQGLPVPAMALRDPDAKVE